MNRMKAAGSVGAALLMCAASPSMLRAQAVQAQRPAAQPAAAQPAPQAPVTPRPTTVTQETPRAQAVMATRRSGALQGFSVVLVIGELQGTQATDDVPAAARKALADMREFLPYKSYRLMDAGWLMCCGERSPSSERRSSETPSARSVSTLALRGPDEHEYELHLTASRTDNARVFVQFNLLGTPPPSADTVNARTNQRRIADLEDKSELLQKQIADAKRRVEAGVAPAGAEILKMELELRSNQRTIAELRERVAEGLAARGGARGSSERSMRTAVIDTSFTMDVGETVVVGASRPRGATKALIALVTAVPRTGTGGTKD
jgi:hypothetical protein